MEGQMGRQKSWLGILILAACCLTVGVPRTAAAQVVLIGPGFGSYTAGQQLPDDPTLDIPPCITITLRIGNKFQQFSGRYQGPLSAYKDPKMSCFVMGERVNVYVQYFQQICEKQNQCDATCTAVFGQLPDKTSMKLQCP
jgi:hypothetical protein